MYMPPSLLHNLRQHLGYPLVLQDAAHELLLCQAVVTVLVQLGEDLLHHLLCTGMHFMVRSGFCEYEVKKLRSPACSRQENAIFPPHINGTLYRGQLKGGG